MLPSGWRLTLVCSQLTNSSFMMLCYVVWIQTQSRKHQKEHDSLLYFKDMFYLFSSNFYLLRLLSIHCAEPLNCLQAFNIKCHPYTHLHFSYFSLIDNASISTPSPYQTMWPTLPSRGIWYQFRRLYVWMIMSLSPEEDLNIENVNHCLILAPRFKEKEGT